jgi:uncharacterized protein YbaR (Trm112 family)
MFIELLDFLRCPNAHEESWLVLAATRADGRDIMEGVLGCPVCHVEYPIDAGVVAFSPHCSPAIVGAPNEEEALRLAATLELTGSHGYAVLAGSWIAQARLLQTMTDVPLVLVNPPRELEMGRGLSGLTIDPDWVALPIAGSTARAIALDEAGTPLQLAAAISTLGVGGRILAPLSLERPQEMTELARDDRHWVAQRARAARSSGIVSLERRR